MELNQDYIYKTIIGVNNLNKLFESIKDLNIEEGDFDYYCDSRHPDPNKTIFFVQYLITK